MGDPPTSVFGKGDFLPFSLSGNERISPFVLCTHIVDQILIVINCIEAAWSVLTGEESEKQEGKREKGVIGPRRRTG